MLLVSLIPDSLRYKYDSRAFAVSNDVVCQVLHMDTFEPIFPSFQGYKEETYYYRFVDTQFSAVIIYLAAKHPLEGPKSVALIPRHCLPNHWIHSGIENGELVTTGNWIEFNGNLACDSQVSEPEEIISLASASALHPGYLTFIEDGLLKRRFLDKDEVQFVHFIYEPRDIGMDVAVAAAFEVPGFGRARMICGCILCLWGNVFVVNYEIRTITGRLILVAVRALKGINRVYIK